MALFEKILGKDIAPEEKSDKDLCDFVRRKVEETRQSAARSTHESIWMTNIAYLAGYNSVRYDSATRTYRAVGRTDPYFRRNGVYVNKILSTVQNRLSRLVKSRPKYQVAPNSNDNEDKESARLGEQVLDMLWHKEELSAKQLELYMWLQQCGHAYLKVSWDPSMGDPILDPSTGESMFEGDIRVDVVSPFEVFPDPLAKSFRDCQYLIQAKVRKLEYFKEVYGEKGAEVKEEGAWLLSAQYAERINALNNVGNTTDQKELKNAAIELVYYEKRSKDRPNGRMIVTANGVLLEDKELPTGEIPLVKFDDVLIAGKYYSEAIITHLRPLQDQYNRNTVSRFKFTNRLFAGKYISARGANLSQEALNDEHGEIVEYDPVPNAAPPTPLQPPTIPNYVYNEDETIVQDMNDLSGINEVSRGQAPGQGITAAIALQYLSEQDDTRVGVVARRAELALARFGRLMLNYAGKFYQTPRLLKIAGQNMDYAVKSFVGADLRGNYDVRVIEGSTLPGSITAKRDFALLMYNQGLLGDPADPMTRDKVLKLVEFGDVGGVWQDMALDLNQSKKHIEMIEQGIAPEIDEMDNHALCLQEMNRYRKGDKFSKLPQEIQILFRTIMEQHVEFLTNQSNPQLGMQEQQLAQEEQQLSAEMAATEGATVPTQDELMAMQDTAVPETQELQ